MIGGSHSFQYSWKHSIVALLEFFPSTFQPDVAVYATFDGSDQVCNPGIASMNPHRKTAPSKPAHRRPTAKIRSFLLCCLMLALLIGFAGKRTSADEPEASDRLNTAGAELSDRDAWIASQLPREWEELESSPFCATVQARR